MCGKIHIIFSGMDYNVCSADPLEPISSTTDELTCSYFVERKNRFCKMLTKRGNIYCGQHQPSVNTVEVRNSNYIVRHIVLSAYFYNYIIPTNF